MILAAVDAEGFDFFFSKRMYPVLLLPFAFWVYGPYMLKL